MTLEDNRSNLRVSGHLKNLLEVVMNRESGQSLVGLAVLLFLILVVVYFVWPWLNLVVVPWIVARFYGLLAGDLYSWAWLLLIAFILALVGRRYY